MELLAERSKLRKQLQLTRGSVSRTSTEVESDDIPIPFEEATLALLCVGASTAASCGAGSSPLIMEVEVERLKPLVSGAR